jgi:hypothetical protein
MIIMLAENLLLRRRIGSSAGNDGAKRLNEYEFLARFQTTPRYFHPRSNRTRVLDVGRSARGARLGRARTSFYSETSINS